MKWISVKEKLPEELKDVIVAVTGTFTGGDKYQTMVASGAWFGEGKWWYSDCSYTKIGEIEFDPQKEFTVTHWTNYPKLPKLEDH